MVNIFLIFYVFICSEFCIFLKFLWDFFLIHGLLRSMDLLCLIVNGWSGSSSDPWPCWHFPGKNGTPTLTALLSLSGSVIAASLNLTNTREREAKGWFAMICCCRMRTIAHLPAGLQWKSVGVVWFLRWCLTGVGRLLLKRFSVARLPLFPILWETVINLGAFLFVPVGGSD